MENRKATIRISEKDIETLGKVDISALSQEVQAFVSDFLAAFADRLPKYKKSREKDEGKWGVAPYKPTDLVALRIAIPQPVLEYCSEKNNVFGTVSGDIDRQIVYALTERA